MTPGKVKGSKNYRFDIRIPGMGRVTKSAKTSSRTEYRNRLAVIHKLIDAGCLDTLRMWKEDRVTIEELRNADREGRLYRVADDMRTARSLDDEIDAWLPIHPNKRNREAWRAF